MTAKLVYFYFLVILFHFFQEVHLYHFFSLSISILIYLSRSLSLDFDIINLKWVDPCYLVVVDVGERVHLIDIVQGDIAVENIRDMQLAYATTDFKV